MSHQLSTRKNSANVVSSAESLGHRMDTVWGTLAGMVTSMVVTLWRTGGYWGWGSTGLSSNPHKQFPNSQRLLQMEGSDIFKQITGVS